MEIPQQSVWRDAPKKEYPKLEEGLEADIAIIGGGLTGICAAYLLRKSGRKVVLLESDTLGNAATGLTTAFLIETLDTKPSKLISFFGKDAAREILQSHREAINWIEDTVNKEHIECDFMRCPFYEFASTQEDAKDLQREVTSARECGLKSSFENELSAPFLSHGYILLSDQAKFHPLKFLFALADIANRDGVEIYEHTRVISLEEKESISLLTSNGTIQAHHVLVATHYPSLERQHTTLFLKKAKYVTYVYEAELPKNTLPEALYENTKNPYNYLRVDALTKHDRLIIGGEDHRADIPIKAEKNFAALASYLKEILQDIPYTIVRKWMGPIIEPGDGAAYIGAINKESNVLYATGYSGNGMTYAVIAAHVFRDHVEGQSNSSADVYALHRKLKPHVIKAKDYIGEFFGGAVKNVFRFWKK